MTNSIGSPLLERIKALILEEPDLLAQAIADRCGCSRSTVSLARAQLGMRKWRWTRNEHIAGPSESDKAIPHCSCGLRLLSEEERQQGRCNGCLPPDASGYNGRRGDQIIAATGW